MVMSIDSRHGGELGGHVLCMMAQLITAATFLALDKTANTNNADVRMHASMQAGSRLQNSGPASTPLTEDRTCASNLNITYCLSLQQAVAMGARISKQIGCLSRHDDIVADNSDIVAKAWYGAKEVSSKCVSLMMTWKVLRAMAGHDTAANREKHAPKHA